MHVCLDIRKVDFPLFDKPVVTLGSFDGVHLGHRTIIRRLLDKSKEVKRIGVIVTYEPHPQSVVALDDAPRLLTTLEEKLKLFEELEVEETVVMNFDDQLKEYSAEEFVQKILVEKLNVGDLVVGEDHAFGKNRTGRIDLLKEVSSKYDFGLEVISAFYVDGVRVSSSQIRKKIESGEFTKAVTMLGHGYPITGIVKRGKGRGKSLDYPTLNLEVSPRKLLPPDGVYSVEVQLEDQSYVGMMYIGPKPTFGEEIRSIEAHVFGLEKDVVDAKVEVLIERWVREPMRFADAKQLIEQLKSDEKTIKQLYSNRWSKLN